MGTRLPLGLGARTSGGAVLLLTERAIIIRDMGRSWKGHTGFFAVGWRMRQGRLQPTASRATRCSIPWYRSARGA
jgi:hypothetical protein